MFSGPIKMLVAVGAGAVYPLAFAPFGFFLLAPTALAALFLVWERCSFKEAVIAGWLLV